MSRIVYVLFFIIQIYQCASQTVDIITSFEELDEDIYNIQQHFSEILIKIQVYATITSEIKTLTSSLIKEKTYQIEIEKLSTLNAAGLIGNETSIQICLNRLNDETKMVLDEAKRVETNNNDDLYLRTINMVIAKDHVEAKLASVRQNLGFEFDDCRHDIICSIRLYIDKASELKLLRESATQTALMIVRRYDEIVADYLTKSTLLRTQVIGTKPDIMLATFSQCIKENY